MFKRMMPGLLMFLGIVLVSGCTSTTSKAGGGLTTRAYVADTQRVDQDMQGGNQGYLMGTPKERGDYKQTRKVYVVEFTKENPEEEGSLIPPPRPKKEYKPVESEPVQEPEWTKPVVVPPVERIVVEKRVVSDGACEEYIVKKGDTLQKIAKKVYGSYGKWGKIYEANKDKMSDPDQLKVGMKLCIPGGAVRQEAVETENLK